MEDAMLKKIMYIRIYTALYRRDTELNLARLELKSIPRILDELTHIKRLNLNGNDIKEIDFDTLVKLNLEWLNISGNPIPENQIKKAAWLLPSTEIVYEYQFRISPKDKDEINNRLIDSYFRRKKHKALKAKAAAYKKQEEE